MSAIVAAFDKLDELNEPGADTAVPDFYILRDHHSGKWHVHYWDRERKNRRVSKSKRLAAAIQAACEDFDYEIDDEDWRNLV